MENLYQALLGLEESGRYPFHMPGHKRNLPDKAGFLASAAKIDITEIDGFDNLHHAEGLIRWENERIARIYGAKESHILVGGSTAGVLSAILSQTRGGDAILLARNSHRSVYHGVILNRLNPLYLWTDKTFYNVPVGAVTAEEVSGVIDEMEHRGEMPEGRPFVVFLTMPTYEGICYDLSSVANLVHERGGLLIVDGAHGAHLRFMEGFEEIYNGADLVIQSLHKTLPALTQTAVLHVMSDRVDLARLRLYLSMLQSSSPSYVLMASVSHLFSLLEEQGEKLFAAYTDKFRAFYAKAETLTKLRVLTGEQIQKINPQVRMDPSKIVILTGKNLRKIDNEESDVLGRYDGYALSRELLEKYSLDVEMAAPSYVLAMTSIMDTDEGFDRLWEALEQIDGSLVEPSSDRALGEDDQTQREVIGSLPQQRMIPAKALDLPKESVSDELAGGRISGEFIFFYPPGIPLLVPGEEISESLAAWIKARTQDCPSLIREGEGFLVCSREN